MSRSARAIAAVKLDALKRRKELLFAAYERIEAQMRAAPDDARRLAIAYEALKDLSFAQQPIHPELGDLGPLVFALREGSPGAENSDFWLAQLERLIACGRRRTAFAFLFGAFLEEQSRDAHDRELMTPDEDAAFAAGLAALDAPAPGWSDGVLDEILGIDPDATAAIKEALKSAGATLKARVKKEEVTEALEALKRRCGPGFLLADELRGARGELMTVELAGAVSIVIDRFEEWRWPEHQTTLRPLRSGQRIRPLLDAPLLSVLVVEIAGQRLSGLLNRAARRAIQGRRRDHRWNLDRVRENRRFNAAFALRERGYNTAIRDSTSVSGLFLELEAERALAAALPDGQLGVVQADIADFYPSLSHAVLGELLEALEAPAELRAFAAAFLRPEIAVGRTQQRGLPLGFALGDVLADLLLFFLDRAVEAAGARSIRVVDDILILSEEAGSLEAATKALGRFLDGCGLSLRPEKCGSKRRGSAPESWPEGPLRWGFLALDEASGWLIDEAAAASFEDGLRERLTMPLSLAAFVREYNAAARSFVERLAPFAALGEAHEAAVKRRALRFRDGLFRSEDGGARGVFEEAQRRFKERFGGELTASESCLVWPVTAGGIGLFDPYLEVTAYLAGKRKIAPPPKDREDFTACLRYFSSVASSRDPDGPQKTRAMEALIEDFIDRGTEIRGAKQTRLGAYWQWVLTIHGPQILEKLGSFRFLRTELVPMLMIAGEAGPEEAEPGQARPATGDGRYTTPDDIPF